MAPARCPVCKATTLNRVERPVSSSRIEHRRSAHDPLPERRPGGVCLLVRKHQGPLFNFALRHLRSQPTAEEVVQDAFVRVVQNAADFKHEARFSTWLYTITRNLCIDQIRKSALRRHPSLDEPKRTRRGRRTDARRADGRQPSQRGAARSRGRSASGSLAPSTSCRTSSARFS